MVAFIAPYANLIGIIGVILILIGYFLLQAHVLTARCLPYSLFNFFGAWLILISLFYHWNLASVVIEVAWIAISMIGITQYIIRQRQARASS